jgi:cytochrome c556
MFRKILLITLLTAISTGAFAASAEERAQTAIDTRQGLLKVVVSYFGPIVGMARGQIPFDAAVIETNAGKNCSTSANARRRICHGYSRKQSEVRC